MSRPRKGEKIRLSPFVPILIDQLNSIAFTELLPIAVKVFCHFKRIDGILRKKNGEQFNGIFGFTYSEAATLGFGANTFSRSIADLNAKGFIDIIDAGGLRGNAHSNAKYKLSERWRDYGRNVFMSVARYPSEPASNKILRTTAKMARYKNPSNLEVREGRKTAPTTSNLEAMNKKPTSNMEAVEKITTSNLEVEEIV